LKRECNALQCLSPKPLCLGAPIHQMDDARGALPVKRFSIQCDFLPWISQGHLRQKSRIEVGF
jgi:hypothetical protein